MHASMLARSSRPTPKRMDRDPSVMRQSPSRSVTDRLLGDLRDGRFRARAWARFFSRASVHSLREAATRPTAFLELTALHAGLAVLSQRRSQDGPGRRWIACSWALAVTHLGLLEHRRRIGLADLLTLVRANAPVIAPEQKTLTATLAAGTDLLDGRLARRNRTATPFGRFADPFADAAFWSWYALRHESSPSMRMMVWGAWGGPVIAATVLSVARGRMVDPPRPRWLRPGAAIQIVLLHRALARALTPPARRGRSPTPH